jgi:hypothetical protein
MDVVALRYHSIGPSTFLMTLAQVFYHYILNAFYSLTIERAWRAYADQVVSEMGCISKMIHVIPMLMLHLRQFIDAHFLAFHGVLSGRDEI